MLLVIHRWTRVLVRPARRPGRRSIVHQRARLPTCSILDLQRWRSSV